MYYNKSDKVKWQCIYLIFIFNFFILLNILYNSLSYPNIKKLYVNGLPGWVGEIFVSYISSLVLNHSYENLPLWILIPISKVSGAIRTQMAALVLFILTNKLVNKLPTGWTLRVSLWYHWNSLTDMYLHMHCTRITSNSGLSHRVHVGIFRVLPFI